MDLMIYTHYYRCNTADRQQEIKECLVRKQDHPTISKVALFQESAAPPLRRASARLEVVD